MSFNVLALRLTCRAVCCAVDTLLRLPMGVFARVDGWLRSQPVFEPPEVKRWELENEYDDEEEEELEEADNGFRVRALSERTAEDERVWWAYAGRANAKLHELRYSSHIPTPPLGDYGLNIMRPINRSYPSSSSSSAAWRDGYRQVERDVGLCLE
jgi:hypothetical protein